jgi:hypothetical protein
MHPKRQTTSNANPYDIEIQYINSLQAEPLSGGGK